MSEGFKLKGWTVATWNASDGSGRGAVLRQSTASGRYYLYHTLDELPVGTGDIYPSREAGMAALEALANATR